MQKKGASSEAEILFSDQLDSLPSIHNDFAASASCDTYSLKCDEDATLDSLLSQALEQERDSYILLSVS